MPWIEDNFLYYFTKDNKASYATRGTLPSPPPHHHTPISSLPKLTKALLATEQLDKAKVTNIEQVNTLQDGVHNLAAGQVGQGGLLQPVGDMLSKEGVNRAERGGKDDKGGILPSGSGGLGGLGIPGLGK